MVQPSYSHVGLGVTSLYWLVSSWEAVCEAAPVFIPSVTSQPERGNPCAFAAGLVQ